MKNKFELVIGSKKVYYLIFFAILSYVVFLFYADSGRIFETLRKISIGYVIIVLMLTVMAHYMLFLRWNFLLKSLKINIPFKNNIKIYLSSWAMFFTPAKTGELIKCFFLKKMHNVPYKVSTPIIFIEQLSDLVIIVLFSFWGIYLFKIMPFKQAIKIFLLLFLIIIVFFLTLSSKRMVNRIILVSKKIPLLKKYSQEFKRAYLTASTLTKPKVLFSSLLFSFGFWFLFSLILYTLLKSFNTPLILMITTPIFALSTLIGVLSFIPSGVGIMEASTFALLTSQGIDKSIAAICLVIMRIFTLWIGVLFGLLCLWSLNRGLQKNG